MLNRYIKLLFLSSLLVGPSVFLQNLWASPVDEAYQSIPHQQTTFKAAQSFLAAEDSGFLEELFTLSDRALVLRVGTMKWLRSDGHKGISYSQYQAEIHQIVKQLKDLPLTSKLKPIRDLIVDAVAKHAEFFADWSQAKNQKHVFAYQFAQGGAVHPAVDSAHQKLYRAYRELISLFPQESSPNKQAFYDHLCALDFL